MHRLSIFVDNLETINRQLHCDTVIYKILSEQMNWSSLKNKNTLSNLREILLRNALYLVGVLKYLCFTVW